MRERIERVIGTTIKEKAWRGVAVLGVIGGGYLWINPVNGEGNPATPTPVTKTADGFVPTPTATLVPRVESTATPKVTATVKVEATNTPEVVTSTKELPKPAAWDHVPVVSLVKAVNVPSFPKTAAEAAATFGIDGSTREPKRWERTAEGDGWHLSEAQSSDDTKDALNVNPRGYLTEGYYDTKPGHNPYAFVIVAIDGKIPAQGATFWNVQQIDQADKLAGEMAVPKWKDENGNVTVHPVTKIVPNSVVSNQKVETTPVPIKYPDTADKAASFFGGKSEEWKLDPSGNWNFNSKEGAVVITLDGVTADGYNQDGPVVATGLQGKISVRLLGGTMYNINLDEVNKLIDAVQANHPDKKVQVVGIVK